MLDLSILTESERRLIEDNEWRDFHNYHSIDEAYTAIMASRFVEQARKTTVSLSTNPFSLADDPEWRDFHGYKSVTEGRRAILGNIFQDYADNKGRDVSALKKFLDENWPIYFPEQTSIPAQP